MKSSLLPLALAILIGSATLPALPALCAQTGDTAKKGKAGKAGKTQAPRPVPHAVQRKTVKFPAPDGLIITGDLWAAEDKSRAFVLLCHQARSSRGEYRTIAPRLVLAGFNCLAIDQRSGRGLPEVSAGIRNETAARAATEGKGTGYRAAEQDIVAAVVWIRKQGYTGRLTLWGSSYSAALAFVIAVNLEQVDAVIAFSPGEYLRPGDAVADAAAKLTKPVLIVSPQTEKRQADAIFKVTATKKRTLCINPHNLHGSRTLFMAKNSTPAWDAVLNFLRRHGRGARKPVKSK